MAKIVSAKRIRRYQSYQDFLDPDEYSEDDWYGISIQLTNEERQSVFFNIVKELILSRYRNDIWIVKHDDKLMPWFFDRQQRASFPNLTRLIESVDIDYSDSAAFQVNESELINLCPELIKYPSFLSYKDIDCMGERAGVVIKFTSHKTVDVICKSNEEKEQVIDFVSQFNSIKVVQYNVTK